MTKPMTAATDLDAMSEGMLAGYWWQPTKGMAWREDLIPVSVPAALREVGPWLVPIGTDAKLYPLMRRTKLLPNLVKLGQRVTQAGILELARRYGHLGKDASQLTCTGHERLKGESWLVWARESSWLAVLWQLWEWVWWDDAAHLEPFVTWSDGPRAVTVHVAAEDGRPHAEKTRRIYRDGADPNDVLRPPAHAVSFHVEHGQGYPADLVTEDRFRDTLGAVRHFLRVQINGRLAGHVHLALMHNHASALRFVPDSPLTAAYVQFARAVSDGVPGERECANPRCRRAFGGRRNKRYCSDRCRMQLNARRYRERKPLR